MSQEAARQPIQGIACADMDAMFAAIEILERGLARDSLVIVGGDPSSRGVVATCSYSVRAFGVHSAMPSAIARRLCPRAIFLPARHELYSAYSRRIMERLGAFGPLERVSIDEAFVDVGAEGLTLEVGQAIKSAVLESTGITCSVGLSVNKLVSKIASGQAKPDGLVLAPPGTEASFLAPLPVGKLWGVGPKTEERLKALGVATIADLAGLPLATLRERFGQHVGDELWRHSRGIADDRIVLQREPKQVSQERTFETDVLDRRVLWSEIRSQSREIDRRLNRREMRARTVTLKVRFGDFSTVTRSLTREWPCLSAEDIALVAATLLRVTLRPNRPVRLIGVSCSKLERSAELQQLSLPGISQKRAEDR